MLFGVLVFVFFARGATRAFDEYLSSDSSLFMIYRMILYVKGEVVGLCCEVFSVLCVFVVYYIGVVMLIGDELCELFSSAVCVSGADDRVC